MALSYEYTFWHLTPNGWVPGDSKTDFNSWSVNEPSDRVLTIRYEEKMTNPGSVQKSMDRLNEIEDKALVKSLEKQFPFPSRIEIY